LLVLGEVVVRGVRAGKLGVATSFGQSVGGQDRRLLWGFVVGRRAPVDVPVERAPQVVGRRVLRGIERDAVDARNRVMTGRHVDPAEPPAEGDLPLGVEVQPAEHQHPVRFERVHDRRGEHVVRQELLDADTSDFGTDGVGDLRDRDRRRGVSFHG
jgi:hypothetical protein